MNIDNRLEFLRNRNNLYEKEVAEAIGSDPSNYRKWENKKTSIPTRRLIQLADFYQVNIDYILCLTDNKVKITHKEFNRDIIAKRTLEVRKELGMTTQEIADLLNTTPSTWNAYESLKENTIILGSFIYIVCKKSKISADYLLGRTNIKYIR